MADKEKPLIILINPDEDSRTYWRESLEKYLASQGVEAEIREAGTMRLNKSNVMIAFDLIQEVLREGKRPALFITDLVLGSYDYGGHIVGALRRGDAAKDQDKVWPEGRNIPSIVVSGGLPGVQDAASQHPNTLSCSCICLHDELNDPAYNGRGRESIEAFKKFVHQALGFPPPQVTHAARAKPPSDSWEQDAKEPREWERPNRGG